MVIAQVHKYLFVRYVAFGAFQTVAYFAKQMRFCHQSSSDSRKGYIAPNNSVQNSIIIFCCRLEITFFTVLVKKRVRVGIA